MAAAGDAASGRRILQEFDDKPHPDQLYAETAHCEFVWDATGQTITMAASAAVKDVNTTDDTSGNMILGAYTGLGATPTAAAGSITIAKTGTYRLYACGECTGEADENVTLEFKGGAAGATAFTTPAAAKCLIAFGTDADNLTEVFAFERRVDLSAGNVVKLTVLGQNSEVITFTNGSWGLELVKSAAY